MKTATICTVTSVNRPKRQLIYLISKSATDYFSYCEEVGCEWEGLLNSIHEKFDTAALINLPDFLQEKGISKNMICKELDIPRSNFNRYCRNEFQRLDANLICKLCNYFECEIGELIRYVKE